MSLISIGPECMSEEKNSTLQWFDNFKFYNIFMKSDHHASSKQKD